MCVTFRNQTSIAVQSCFIPPEEYGKNSGKFEIAPSVSYTVLVIMVTGLCWEWLRFTSPNISNYKGFRSDKRNCHDLTRCMFTRHNGIVWCIVVF